MDMSEKLVTGVAALDKKRYKVFINDEFAFVLYRGELHSLGIEDGMTVAQSNYDKIFKEILPKRAKRRAMNLLKKRNYTEKQLYDKLKQAFYPEEIIEQALAYVKSFHYVDDEQYARDYIEYHGADRPVKRLEADLQKKGIKRELIEKALLDFREEAGVIDECGMIRKFLQKKNFDPNGVSWQEKQKMCAALISKGFRFENIRSVLSLDIT